MKIDIINIKGEKTGEALDLDDKIFAIKPNDHAIYLDVKRILANNRQGTHSSKEKWAITGSTRKLFKQKGTGGARRGSIKSPLLKGGGRVFGPHPHGYSIKINKKVSILAIKSSLTHKVNNNKLLVVEDFNLEIPKTKVYSEIIKKLELLEKKHLLVTNNFNDKNIRLSARNITNAFVCDVEKLNTYTILNNDTLILMKGTLVSLNKILS
jgi:large subunit ribosomal protein L4